MSLSVLALCVVVIGAVSAAPQKGVSKMDQAMLKFNPVEEFEKLWAGFKKQHNKNYAVDEEAIRRDIFLTNMKKVEMHNYLHDKGLKSYRLGLNEYADLEHKEFVGLMNGFRPRLNVTVPRGATYLSSSVPVSLPDQVDWRTKGAVTPVKNQGHCGSCWSFSTTGSLEGQHFKKTGKLVSLSEQNLVDCSGKYGNQGCNGGLMDNAFQYIKENGGIDTEESYPYEAEQETCRYKKSGVGAEDVGFVDVPKEDEDKLKEAIATVGPVSIAIDASHQSFQLYSSGVYDEEECSSTQLDHGVLAAGYGTLDGQDYWLVKNSWGPTWGNEGYIYMSRNKDNQCGVASQASYPLV